MLSCGALCRPATFLQLEANQTRLQEAAQRLTTSLGQQPTEAQLVGASLEHHTLL